MPRSQYENEKELAIMRNVINRLNAYNEKFHPKLPWIITTSNETLHIHEIR
jgi:hypothetical protein